MRLILESSTTTTAPSLRVWRAATVGLTALTALLALAPPAHSSCAGPASVERDLGQSDLVFVGSIVRLANRDRWATFAVEDVWKGSPGGAIVEVRAGPEDPGGGRLSGSSNDRTFRADVRYLVFAFDASGPDAGPSFFGRDARWTDSICSSTQPYTAELARLRPPAPAVTGGPSTTFPAVQPPPPTDLRPSPDNDGDGIGWMTVIMLATLVALAGSVGFRRASARSGRRVDPG